MSSVYIIVNKWLPTGGEIEATDIVTVRSTEEKALAFLEGMADSAPGFAEVKANGYVVEVPLRGTDFNTYYIEERDVE